MCRIAGMVHKGLAQSQIEVKVKGMCDLLKHGGPDDEGLFSSSDSSLVLGNRRLALIDLTSSGHQPMQYRQRYYITYNGELYNYLTLKHELRSLGHQFSNHTDTEVILAAFAQWHVQSFARLKGMFAFALWDEPNKELFIVRDPAGIKPIYYSTQSGVLAFASEIRAFRDLMPDTVTNQNWPVYLMAYGHIPEPVSTLNGVLPLAKGCYLKYNVVNGKTSLQSFCHYSYRQSTTINDSSITTKVKTAIDQSVRRHLIADAPVGVFLSGGLDSGIIAAMASKYKQTKLHTLSLYFSDPEYSEKKYQDLIISRLKCENHQYLLEEDEFHKSFPGILDDMDMPSCDGINTWYISKFAAEQGLKAVLSGIGGDELFGGYPSFRRISRAGLLQKLPGTFVRSGKRSNAKKLNRMAYLQMDGVKGLYLFLRGHFSPFEIARQLGAYESDIWWILNSSPELIDITGLSGKNQASWMEFNLYMQNQLLRDADVMSMIHGVEIRVPFLDHDLIQLALSIDPVVKYQGPLTKQFLINAFKDELPSDIWDRPKMGFSFPFAKWLSNSSYVKTLMENGNPTSQKSYAKFLKGKMHWSHLMSLVILNKKRML